MRLDVARRPSHSSVVTSAIWMSSSRQCHGSFPDPRTSLPFGIDGAGSPRSRRRSTSIVAASLTTTWKRSPLTSKCATALGGRAAGPQPLTSNATSNRAARPDVIIRTWLRLYDAGHSPRVDARRPAHHAPRNDGRNLHRNRLRLRGHRRCPPHQRTARLSRLTDASQAASRTYTPAPALSLVAGSPRVSPRGDSPQQSLEHRRGRARALCEPGRRDGEPTHVPGVLMALQCAPPSVVRWILPRTVA